jgi:hypothetical protein
MMLMAAVRSGNVKETVTESYKENNQSEILPKYLYPE